MRAKSSHRAWVSSVPKNLASFAHTTIQMCPLTVCLAWNISYFLNSFPSTPTPPSLLPRPLLPSPSLSFPPPLSSINADLQPTRSLQRDRTRDISQTTEPTIATHRATTTSHFLERRTLEKRCRYTTGGWCGAMDQQQPLQLRPPPRGNRTCPHNCSGAGNCNHDTGTCDCPAGEKLVYSWYARKVIEM